MASQEVTLDSVIPTGEWSLYFHSPEENRWTLSTFSKVATFKTWGDFFHVMEGLGEEAFHESMFFLMKGAIPPLWEDSRYIRGGCYSFKIRKHESMEAYMRYAIATMLEAISKDSNNVITGLTISPKKAFNVIKAWGMNAQLYNSPSDLHYGIHPSIHEKDGQYAKFLQKKM